jgi:hypothetical protein
MTCDDLREQLADYLGGQCDGERRAAVETHLGMCAECREDVAMWARMEDWPNEQPSPALRGRVNDVISAYRAGVEQAERPAERKRAWAGWLASAWSFRPAFQYGLAAICLAAGLAGGYGLARRGSDSSELATLRQEMVRTQQLVAVSLLQQQSASERLRGVTYSNRVEQADSEVLAALVHTVKYDSSVDVRLAAVDALRRFTAQPAVRDGVVDALRAQQSPLVHLALIDLAVEARIRQSADVLRTIQSNPDMNNFVRERAGWGLQQF